MKDYRLDGPPEARALVRDHRACETAPNGTGGRCACDFDCANYWLRAKGFKAESSPESISVIVAAPKRKRWWRR